MDAPQMTTPPRESSEPIISSQYMINFVYETACNQTDTDEQMQPPRRPRRNIPETREYQRYKNAFLLDFENACLQINWDGAPPKGVNRHENPEWAAMIQSMVYPYHSDVDWYEYCEWVMGGGGDEWFYDEPA